MPPRALAGQDQAKRSCQFKRIGCLEEIPSQENNNAHALAGKDRAEKSCQFKGIRYQKWGSWVAEIQMLRSRQKLWLVSYTTT